MTVVFPEIMVRTSTPSPSVAAFPGRVGISPEEFAAAVGLGRTLVYIELAKHTIPHKKVGRRIIIPLAALDAWLGDSAA